MLNSNSGFFASKEAQERVVSTCSTGVQSTDVTCFTNAACVPETPVVRATGQLQWKSLDGMGYASHEQNVSRVRWGTAFFIAPDLIMTAGHCFDICDGSESSGFNITPHFLGEAMKPAEFAPLLNLNMNYEHQTCLVSHTDNPAHTETSFSIIKLVERRLGGLDYAIAQVAGAPGNTYGMVEFEFNFVGGKIYIPQHPNGEPKKIEYGISHEALNKNSLIRYTANTLPGSSGSAVSTLKHKVCALHIQGPGLHHNFNEGVNVRAIFKFSKVLQGISEIKQPRILREPSVFPLKFSNVGFLCLALAAFGCGLKLFSKNKDYQKLANVLIATGIIGAIADCIINSSQNSLVEHSRLPQLRRS